MTEKTIYFDRNDKDTWAMARLHHSLLKEIEDNPLWEREEIPDIPLTDEQVERLLEATRGLPPYLFVMLGLYAGLRREEILALKWDSVYLDLDAPYLTVQS